MNVRHSSSTFLALLLTVAVAGCKGEAAPEATASTEVAVETEAAIGAEAVVEEHDGGSVAWEIAPDGNVKAAVSGPDGKRIRENVNGTLAWKVDGEAKTVPLAIDAKSGLLIAAGPKLEADLTQLDYTLTVDGKPWTGALHLPRGGTAELVAGAKASVDIEVPEGKLGPHGGVIQVVGKERLELVADEVSGEVRIYLLDADFNAVAVGDHEVTLGVTAGAPQILVLTAAEGGAYFTGKWALDVDPLKVTILLKSGASAAVALVGYRPGARIVVSAKAPRVKVRVKTKWAAHADVDPDVDVHAKVAAKGHANGKVDVHGPSVKVKVTGPKIPTPKVSVNAGAKGGAKGGAKAGAKAGVSLKLK